MTRKLVLATFILILIAGAAVAAQDTPKPVKMDGQMVCLWCDAVVSAMPEKANDPHKCGPIFKASDGKVYTLVPDKMGNDLGSLKMHEQKVQVDAYVLPGSQIIEVKSYKVIEKVEPVTPEEEPWFNF